MRGLLLALLLPIAAPDFPVASPEFERFEIFDLEDAPPIQRGRDAQPLDPVHDAPEIGDRRDEAIDRQP